MNYSFVPSLQCMAAVKIATVLWNQADVRALIADGCNSGISQKEHFRKIAEKVIEKVSLLPQPTLLKDKAIAVVRPLGDQILKWKNYTEAVCHLKFSIENFPKELCWTSRGTLDQKKIAESLVGDITIPERERYQIACCYCIETQRDKSIKFHVTQSCLLDSFIAYWAYNITGDEDGLNKIPGRDTSKNPYQCAFEWAIRWRNRLAAEYYFHKLTPELKEESLSDIKLFTGIQFDFDIYYFLILHMNEQQQLRLLEVGAVDVLKSLLEWPWQDFFMEMANRAKDVLDGRMYYDLLDRILKKIELEYKYCSYRELFGKLWLQIPATHKKCVIRKCIYEYVFHRLFKVNDEKNILLILKDATLEEKEDYVFNSEGISICLVLTNAKQWNLLKAFISERITTREKMIEFKDICKKRDFGEKFFQLMDELIEKCSEKRGAEEANCSVFKRLRSSSSESAM